MSERSCHVCGEDAWIFDRKGGWCRAHWDEAEAERRTEWKRQTEEAGGPWRHTCPYRMQGWGPWERKEDLDTWTIREQLANGLVARHCDFCGSLHPDDLVRLITEEGCQVERTDKGYKFYVRSHSGQETKFKTHHLTNEHRAKLRDFYERPVPPQEPES